MTLRIKPVKLKQSIYFRVPNDIADLISIEPNAEVTLSLQDQDKQFLLVYSVTKSPIAEQARPFAQRIQNSESEHLVALPRAHRTITVESRE
jgi:hypothetical protein